MSFEKIKVISPTGLMKDIKIVDENGVPVPGVGHMFLEFYAGDDGAILHVDRYIADKAGRKIANSHNTGLLQESLEFRCSNIQFEAEKMVYPSEDE